MWKKINEKLFKTKRTSIWILPDSQTRFVWDIVKHYVLVLFVFIFFSYVHPFAGLFSIHSVETHQEIFHEFLQINQSKWPLWIVLAFVFVFYAVMLSHRVFGPIYKLQSYLDNDRKENLTYPLSFRDGDYHEQLSETINQYKQSHDQKKQQLLLRLNQLAEKYPQDNELGDIIKELS